MGKVVLVIDDDEDLITVMEFRLSKAGFTVKKAIDAGAGFELIKQVKPDIILLDIQMPGMSGGDFAKKIQEDTHLAQIPIIFITGKVDIDKNSLPSKENIAIVIKPCNFDELVAKINQMTNS